MTRQTFNNLPAPQQAGILANDEAFRQFVGTRTVKSGVTVSPEAAAEYLRQMCQITSRRHLKTNLPARTRFDALRTEFDAWRGRIPKQR